MLSPGDHSISGLMATTKAPAARHRAASVEYPYSDGKAMAESPRHVDAIVNALATLRNRFATSPHVQVGANMNLFYEEGDPEKKLVPDLFVVRGLAALPEPSYKVWEEGCPPGFVLEVASPSSEDRDRGEKQALYASMGVTEYWRFNPVGALEGASKPDERLEGGTLAELGYEPLARQRDGSIASEVLGLEVRVDDRPGLGHLLRFRDPRSGEDLLTFRESEEGRTEAERALQEAERALREAEQQLRAVSAAGRAGEDALRAEAAARQDAESEIARLKSRIAALEASQATDGPVTGR